MTGMARKFPLTAVTSLAVSGVPATARLPGAMWVPTAIGFGPISAGEER